MDPNDPTAQGQQAAAETQNPPAESVPVEQQQQQSQGIQARIDQLTAKYRQTEEMLAQQQAINAQLLAAQAERMYSHAPPPPAEPAVDIDPEDRRKLEAVLTPYTRKLEAMVNQLQGQVGAHQVRMAAPGEDPRVIQAAEKLYAQWQRQGKQGWVPEDAITFARGQLSSELAGRAQQGRSERGQFNSMSDSVVTSQSVPAAPPAPHNAALPANFDNLSPDQQIALMESRLNGKSF